MARVGATMAPSEPVRSIASSAAQVATYPETVEATSIERAHPTTPWGEAANDGLNQRATTSSATAAIPPASTKAARAAQRDGGPNNAEVQSNMSLSTRDGACAATHNAALQPHD